MNILASRWYQILCYPLSLLFHLMVWLRNICYDKNIFQSFQIERCKIISVGNIAIGGTGKTPVIRFLAEYLSMSGFKTVILSRGYGRKSNTTVIVSDGAQIVSQWHEAGDEPYLLAQQLKQVPVVVEVDRYKGAQIIQKQFDPDFILLDDGFQHRRLKRDLDIVLIDASLGWGKGLLLPAGFLREPITSLKRADLIWFTRVDQATDFAQLVTQVQKLSCSPIIQSCHQPTALIQANTGKKVDLVYLNKKSALLFSGIANPGSFQKTVANLGAEIVDHLKFSDHYQYRAKDIQTIIQKARNVNAELIITTEKDFVRITNFTPGLSNLFVLVIEIRIHHDDLLKLQKKLENLN